jgi:Domain of unknown function (DUF1844)
MSSTPLGGSQDAPKIIVDSDWKAQAQREREKLAEQEKQAAAKRAASAPARAASAAAAAASGGPSNASEAGDAGAEPADFRALVGTLATQALMYMGAFPDPQTGRAVVSLEYARFNIDLLDVLEAKTTGNLSDDEKSDLRQVLSELRMRFVEIVKAVEQASKEGRLSKMSAVGGTGLRAAGGGAGLTGISGMSGMSGMSGPGF